MPVSPLQTFYWLLVCSDAFFLWQWEKENIRIIAEATGDIPKWYKWMREIATATSWRVGDSIIRFEAPVRSSVM